MPQVPNFQRGGLHNSSGPLCLKANVLGGVSFWLVLFVRAAI